MYMKFNCARCDDLVASPFLEDYNGIYVCCYCYDYLRPAGGAHWEEPGTEGTGDTTGRVEGRLCNTPHERYHTL